jgi:hypothetical protein
LERPLSKPDAGILKAMIEGKTLDRYRFLSVILLIFMVATPQVSRAGDTTAPAWNFLPVAIAFACDKTTPQAARRIVERSPNALPSVYGPQCVDQRHQVTNIKPTSMRLIHLKAANLYELRLQIPADKASALQQLTQNADGQRTIVLVADKAIIDSMLFGPFTGDIFVISADSEDDGVKTASLFVK